MLKDMSLSEFIDTLASDKPAPGGGSAAALAGCIAASLASMVAGLTIGKKQYMDVEEEMKQVQKKAQSLKDALLLLVDKDSQSYLDVMQAFRLPKESDEEKQTRLKAIQAATLEAAEVPLLTMKKTFEVVELLQICAEKGNRFACTDAGVGALMLVTASEGAYRNVMINLDSLKNQDDVNRLSTEAKNLLAQTKEEAEKIRQTLFG